MTDHLRGSHRGWFLRAEREVFRSRQHWIVVVRDLLLAGPVVLAVLLVRTVLSRRSPGSSLVSLPVVVTILTVILWALVRWLANTLTLTRRHLILGSGVLVRVRSAIPLVQIRRVVIRRMILGLLLGYGTLEFYVLAMERPERFRFAPNSLLDEELYAPPPPQPLPPHALSA